MKQIKLKNVKELKEYLKDIPDKTPVKVFMWDCYNDEPYHRDVMPVQMKTKTGKIKELSL